MIIDSTLEFSDAQDLSQVAGSYNSTNVLDLGAADRDKGVPIPIDILVDETFTSAGAATLQVQVVTATDAAFSTPVVLVETRAIAKATLVAGYRIPLSVIPPGVLQFVKLIYIIGTATTTAGTCSAFIPASVDEPFKAA